MLKPSVQIHEQEGILIAEFWDCWRLDPAPVQELRSRYEAHLRKKGRPEVVVDLSGVGFAGSAALGNFVALHRDARRNDGRLIFCNVEPTVTEVFRASKLEPLFEFAADRAAALAIIAKGPAPGPTDGRMSSGGLTDPGRAAPGGLAGSGPLRRRRSEPDPG
jgi:anti-anti-sigma factor